MVEGQLQLVGNKWQDSVSENLSLMGINPRDVHGRNAKAAKSRYNNNNNNNFILTPSNPGRLSRSRVCTYM